MGCLSLIILYIGTRKDCLLTYWVWWNWKQLTAIRGEGIQCTEYELRGMGLSSSNPLTSHYLCKGGMLALLAYSLTYFARHTPCVLCTQSAESLHTRKFFHCPPMHIYACQPCKPSIVVSLWCRESGKDLSYCNTLPKPYPPVMLAPPSTWLIHYNLLVHLPLLYQDLTKDLNNRMAFLFGTSISRVNIASKIMPFPCSNTVA